MDLVQRSDAPQRGYGVTSCVPMLLADGLNIVEKSAGLATSARDGLISDLSRFVPYFLAGMLVSLLGKSFWHVVFWSAVLNSIDKVFLGWRVSTLPSDVIEIQTASLLIGLASIYAATLPLCILIGASAFNLLKLTPANAEPTNAKRLAWLAICFAVCAILVPFVDVLIGFALNSVAEMPIFYLSLSTRAPPVLYWTFVVAATLSLILYLIESAVRRATTSKGIFFTGLILLLVALFLFKGLWGLWAER